MKGGNKKRPAGRWMFPVAVAPFSPAAKPARPRVRPSATPIRIAVATAIPRLIVMMICRCQPVAAIRA